DLGQIARGGDVHRVGVLDVPTAQPRSDVHHNLDALRDDLGHALAVGDVAAHHLDACRTQTICAPGPAFQRKDVRPVVVEPPRQLPADKAGRAGDQHALACQCATHGTSFEVRTLRI